MTVSDKPLSFLLMVHPREDLDGMKKYLTDLGATQVLTYDDLDDNSISERVTEWTSGKVCGPTPPTCKAPY